MICVNFVFVNFFKLDIVFNAVIPLSDVPRLSKLSVLALESAHNVIDLYAKLGLKVIACSDPALGWLIRAHDQVWSFVKERHS